VREFAPQLLEGKAGRMATVELRRLLRRCLALYHPDKQVMKGLKERVESEEIFAVVKKAYEELQD
jgi:DnaJ-class molecular chaperone